MMDLEWIVAMSCLGIYLICSLWFMAGVLMQLALLRRKRLAAAHKPPYHVQQYLPSVTIQVPVYNERMVIGRLLAALSHLDYPRHLLILQVLDDSTDDTSIIVNFHVNTLRESGFQVELLRRSSREGYKAGALQAGLVHCQSELIAIFDSDFEPSPDFLLRLVGHFTDPSVGAVQARWIHRNLSANYLTTIQAFLLDSHFTIEQDGRAAAGFLLNFNGTAGIWRRACILDSGGWNGSILSEDLDLSYRAQLRKWVIRYDGDVLVPADLPENIAAFKNQQFRWAKGMAQTARAHLGNILTSSLQTGTKWHAIFHVLGSLSFVSVLLTVLMTLPILLARQYLPGFHAYSQLLLFSGISLPLIAVYYYVGTRNSFSRQVFWTHFPVFLIVYMGLAIQNSIGVLQGFFGYATPFVRTPKGSCYVKEKTHGRRGDNIRLAEVMAIAYLLCGIFFSCWWKDYFLLLFLMMMTAGLIMLLGVKGPSTSTASAIGTEVKSPIRRVRFGKLRGGLYGSPKILQ